VSTLTFLIITYLHWIRISSQATDSNICELLSLLMDIGSEVQGFFVDGKCGGGSSVIFMVTIVLLFSTRQHK
jgi:hypothetical protein